MPVPENPLAFAHCDDDAILVESDDEIVVEDEAIVVEDDEILVEDDDDAIVVEDNDDAIVVEDEEIVVDDDDDAIVVEDDGDIVVVEMGEDDELPAQDDEAPAGIDGDEIEVPQAPHAPRAPNRRRRTILPRELQALALVVFSFFGPALVQASCPHLFDPPSSPQQACGTRSAT